MFSLMTKHNIALSSASDTPRMWDMSCVNNVAYTTADFYIDNSLSPTDSKSSECSFAKHVAELLYLCSMCNAS